MSCTFVAVVIVGVMPAIATMTLSCACSVPGELDRRRELDRQVAGPRGAMSPEQVVPVTVKSDGFAPEMLKPVVGQ